MTRAPNFLQRHGSSNNFACVAILTITFCKIGTCLLTSSGHGSVASQTGNISGHQPKLERIHVLSMGRVGSSFVLRLLEANGHPVVFEPLAGLGTFEGAGALQQTPRPNLECLYMCGRCGRFSINNRAITVVKQYCSGSGEEQRALAIKETRIIDHGALLQLPVAQLRKTKFVLLLRDPRAVWASTRPKVNWAIHSISLVCKMLLKEVSSLPLLVEAAGAQNVMIAYFEHWSQNVTHFAMSLAAHVGEDASQQLLDLARGSNRSELSTRWFDEGLVPAAELKELEENSHCSRYMSLTGYKKASVDYSELVDLTTPDTKSRQRDDRIIDRLLSEITAGVRWLTKAVLSSTAH